ncbi:MAG: hypothetical protein PHQ75_06575 [Thermoguttaceae bacterium]|nr:hypothetical protein [Thermoguttaceae bacterium]
MEVRTGTVYDRARNLPIRAMICVLISLCLVVISNNSAWAAIYKTRNFVVHARTADLAKKVGDIAEKCRNDLAVLWLGETIRPWAKPCPIKVEADKHLGAGGETSFTFAGGEVFDWKMKVQGSEERICDSVIPHEVSHTIMATYFRQPVPRWIDEGAATSVEAWVEQSSYRQMLVDYLRTGKGIPFNTMVRLKEYPVDQMPFYAQGFSVCEYLIAVGGHRRLVDFAKVGIDTGDWSKAVQQYYGYENLGDLQLRWQDWVSVWFRSGMPDHLPEVTRVAGYDPRSAVSGTLLASNTQVNTNNSVTTVPTGQLIPLPQSSRPLPGPATPVVAASPLSEGVGSAQPEESALPFPPAPVASGSMAAPNGVSAWNGSQYSYQGTYGRGLGTGAKTETTPRETTPIILGQTR